MESKIFLHAKNLNLILGPTGSGKTYGLWQSFQKLKTSHFNLSFKNVIVMCSTINSEDNKKIYNETQIQATFPNVENVLFVPQPEIDSDDIQFVLEWIHNKHHEDHNNRDSHTFSATTSSQMIETYVHERFQHNNSNDEENKDGGNTTQTPSEHYKPTLLILDDIDFPKNSNTIRAFISRDLHHYNICLFWIKQSIQGQLKHFMFSQVSVIGLPTYFPVALKTIRDILTEKNLLDVNLSQDKKALNNFRNYYNHIINESKTQHINMIWMDFKDHYFYGINLYSTFPPFKIIS